MGAIEQANIQSGTPASAKIIEVSLPSNLRAPYHRIPYAVARCALPTMMDQKSGISRVTKIIFPVAIDGLMNPAPHRASSTILRCCCHESSRRHPARAGVKTVMASSVGRTGVLINATTFANADQAYLCQYPM